MVSLPTAMTCSRRRLSEPQRRLPTRARIRALMAVLSSWIAAQLRSPGGNFAPIDTRLPVAVAAFALLPGASKDDRAGTPVNPGYHEIAAHPVRVGQSQKGMAARTPRARVSNTHS